MAVDERDDDGAAATRWVLRRATVEDAERLARGILEGFEGYRAFAPEHWTPPPLEQELVSVTATLADPDGWGLLAEDGGRLAGQTSFLPASRGRRPVEDPGLAHFRTLFVGREWWGSGLARTLHAAAIEEARRRGYTAMRLYTPALQARAQRFYEREGWRQAGPEIDDPALGMAIVEYRLAL